MPTSKPAGDIFRGDRAKSYLAKRTSLPVWQKEHAAVERLLTLVPDESHVLDVPFGTGRFVPLYRAKRMRVTGVDISADMLAAAHEDLGIDHDCCDICVGSADALPFDSASFDLVVSVRFLTDIVSFQTALACLREYQRVTRKFALVMLKSHGRNSPPTPLPQRDERLGVRLSRDELIAMLSGVGFSVTGEEWMVNSKNPDREKRFLLLTRD